MAGPWLLAAALLAADPEGTGGIPTSGSARVDTVRPAARGGGAGRSRVSEDPVRAPRSAAAARFAPLAVTDGEPVAFRWDEARCAEVPDVMFADGFEGGDAAGWSGVSP